jgi:CheY-like chemotaxis protein
MKMSNPMSPPSLLHQDVVHVHPAAKLRVHLVDDNKDAVDSLAQWMSLFGYETCVSYTGPQALEVAETFEPDVMLIDIVLPGMDGYQLAASLRDKEAFQRALFIAVTGLSDQEYQGRCKEAKFNLHFAKPVDLDILQAVLAALAKKKRTSAL